MRLSVFAAFALSALLAALAVVARPAPDAAAAPAPVDFSKLSLYYADTAASASSTAAASPVALNIAAASANNGTDTVASVSTRLLSSINVSSVIVAIVAIISGVVFLGFGHQLFKPVLFLGGFYFFGVLTFCLMENISYKLDKEISDTVYVVVCVVFGILGGLLLVCLWKLGFFFIGALLGFFLANLLLVALHDVISSSVTRWIIIAVFVLVCGFLVIKFEMPVVVVATSIVGSYVLFVGIDVFAQTDFLNISMSIITSGTVMNITAESKWAYMLGGCILVALLGMGFQFSQVRRNGWKHSGLGHRDMMYRPVPRKGGEYQTVPY